jgi:YihY family inner membrane protein
VKKIYNRVIIQYHAYRKVVPSYASAALSFYLLLLLVPATSLLAIGASFFRIDLTMLETIIEQYIKSEYVGAIIDILETKTINTVALITILLSLYIVSKGIRNIYDISKNMYNDNKQENIFQYYTYSIRMTIYLLFIFLGFISMFAIVPLAKIFDFLYTIVLFRHILLYFISVIFLMIIYKMVPRKKIKYKYAFTGAIISSALLLVLYYGLQIYFLFANYETIYGPLASIVAVLFVFNLAAEVFYIGMYITNILYVREEENNERKIND